MARYEKIIDVTNVTWSSLKTGDWWRLSGDCCIAGKLLWGPSQVSQSPTNSPSLGSGAPWIQNSWSCGNDSKWHPVTPGDILQLVSTTSNSRAETITRDRANFPEFARETRLCFQGSWSVSSVTCLLAYRLYTGFSHLDPAGNGSRSNGRPAEIPRHGCRISLREKVRAFGMTIRLEGLLTFVIFVNMLWKSRSRHNWTCKGFEFLVGLRIVAGSIYGRGETDLRGAITARKFQGSG